MRVHTPEIPVLDHLGQPRAEANPTIDPPGHVRYRKNADQNLKKPTIAALNSTSPIVKLNAPR
jgi:hypothetical protein